MRPRTRHRHGFWSAVGVLVLGAAYLITGAVGVIVGSGFPPRELLPAEPYVSICRVLMLLIAMLVVPLFAAVHNCASKRTKRSTLAALGFAIVMAATTGVNNLLLLTLPRRAGSDPFLAHALTCRWPLILVGLELLAWGPVFGLAMLFAAPAFRGDRTQDWTRRTMRVGGLLCLANVLCFVTGDLRYSIAGIVGYDFVFPVVCVLLARLFLRADARSPVNATLT